MKYAVLILSLLVFVSASAGADEFEAHEINLIGKWEGRVYAEVEANEINDFPPRIDIATYAADSPMMFVFTDKLLEIRSIPDDGEADLMLWRPLETEEAYRIGAVLSDGQSFEMFFAKVDEDTLIAFLRDNPPWRSSVWLLTRQDE